MSHNDDLAALRRRVAWLEAQVHWLFQAMHSRHGLRSHNGADDFRGAEQHRDAHDDDAGTAQIQLQIEAMSAGIVQPPSTAVMERAAQQWETGVAFVGDHQLPMEWPGLLRLLDQKDPGWRHPEGVV